MNPRGRLAGIALALLAAGAPALACTSRPAPGRPLEGRILDARSGAFLPEGELLDRLAGARFVLLGERHDHPEHHRLQARVLEGLAGRGRRPAVVFEMLSVDLSAALAEASAREGATPERVRAAVSWDAGGWPAFELYAPVFEAALRAGLPLAAADLPASALAQLRGAGLAGLEPASRQALLLEAAAAPEQRAGLGDDVREGHCFALPEALLPRMVDVQLARDAQLARALEASAAGADGAVLIAGAGHVRRDWAVPWWLRRRAPGASVASLAFLEAAPDQREPAAEALRFDYVWYTAPGDAEDPCERYREQLEALAGPGSRPAAAPGPPRSADPPAGGEAR